MLILASVFVVTIVSALISTFAVDDARRQSVKGVLTVLLPTEAALLGAAVAFYYAGGSG